MPYTLGKLEVGEGTHPEGVHHFHYVGVTSLPEGKKEVRVGEIVLVDCGGETPRVSVPSAL